MLKFLFIPYWQTLLSIWADMGVFTGSIWHVRIYGIRKGP